MTEARTCNGNEVVTLHISVVLYASVVMYTVVLCIDVLYTAVL
jgi:hypothetical protein